MTIWRCKKVLCVAVDDLLEYLVEGGVRVGVGSLKVVGKYAREQFSDHKSMQGSFKELEGWLW